MTFDEAAKALNCHRQPGDDRDRFPCMTLDQLQGSIGAADRTVVHGDRILLTYRFADQPGIIIAEDPGHRGLLINGYLLPARESGPLRSRPRRAVR